MERQGLHPAVASNPITRQARPPAFLFCDSLIVIREKKSSPAISSF
jgi:hypothetical protein